MLKLILLNFFLSALLLSVDLGLPVDYAKEHSSTASEKLQCFLVNKSSCHL